MALTKISRLVSTEDTLNLLFDDASDTSGIQLEHRFFFA